MHNAEIKADRDDKGLKIARFIIDLGLKLEKLNDKGYYPDIPLDVNDYDGHPLYINYSFSQGLSVYGGIKHCINYRMFSKCGICPAGCDTSSRMYCEPFVNALIDGWDDECERKFEYRIAQIMKETIARQMEMAKSKLEKSNNEYAKYFNKE